jgi:DNA-binding NtrC family response regulator
MLSILDGLQLGTAVIDKEGRVTFLSRVAQGLCRKHGIDTVGMPWTELLPFSDADKARLMQTVRARPPDRAKVPVYVEMASGRHYWMEIDIQDDPHEPSRRILFIYDVSEVYDLRRLLDEKARFHGMVGKSGPIQRVYRQIREVAAVDSTVLIEGETGAGKELVAQAIHHFSPRRNAAFIAVNCAGITEALLGSQLFGHRKGAFTGAIADHQGVFEAANGGTIFLDEIGDVPANVQSSLLRVLEQREITRLGDSRPRPIDVRIIAATHHDLAADVAKQSFRADLLYRIRVARIQLPPLRDRRADIPLLVGWFLGQFRGATGKRVEDVSNEAMCILENYAWPGNVRELRNAIEYAAIRCAGPVLQPGDLPPELTDLCSAARTASDPDLCDADEYRRLAAALKLVGGNRTAAARLLSVSRATLYRRLAEWKRLQPEHEHLLQPSRRDTSETTLRR